MGRVRIEMLGRFRMTLEDGQAVPDDCWPARRAMELVQLLALSERRRCLRDRAIDALWPHLGADAGAANLRKAAHFARQAVGDPDVVVLRGGQVALYPSCEVETDVEQFEAAASAALRDADQAACAEVAAAYPGTLLPEALYDEWTRDRREQLRSLRRRLLRVAGEWEWLIEDDPTDETAYRELMKAAAGAGNRHRAIRWYGRLRTALAREVGMLPSPETVALYDECVAGLRPAERVLVGRQVELAYVTEALESAGRGELGLLAMRGPAGIGKSTLCREIATVARHRTWRCVTVAASADAGPYAPLIDLIEQLVTRDRGLLDRLAAPVRSVLAELTMLAVPAPPLAGPLGRQQVIGAVRQVLLAAADAGLIVVVVDDAHLIDDAAADVLLHLSRVTRAGRLLVVLSYRPERAGEVLSRGVARLDRAGAAIVVDLAPLSRDAAVAMISSASPTPLDMPALSGMVDLAAGNPFFLVELAGSATSGVPLAGTSTLWDAVAARFVDLDEQTRSMLEWLAVAGDGHDPAGVLAVTGLPESEAFKLLDNALAAQVLVVSGKQYRFQHELVRQALVERVPPHRRSIVHRDAARRFAAAGGPPETVARHCLDAGRPDEAIGWLLRAAREAMRLGAFSDAGKHLDVVLAHAGKHPEALRLRAEVYEALGDQRAPTAFAAVARVVDGPDWHDARARLALASLRGGDLAGAAEALDGVETSTMEGRLTQALVLSGIAAMGRADPADSLMRAADMRRLAIESGDPAAVVVASWAEASAAHAQGDLPRVLQDWLQATYALPELATSLFDGQLCAAEWLLYGDRPYPEVIVFADALVAEADRLGAARGRAFATTFRGEANLLRGRLDDADNDLANGARLHHELGASAGEAISVQRRAEVALYRGDRHRAQTFLDQALDIARMSPVGFHLYDRIYGARIAAASEPRSAMAALEEAESGIHGALETCPGCRITLAVPAAIASARAGDLDRAARYEIVVEKLSRLLMRQPGWLAALDEVRGHRLLAGGDALAAADRFAAAAATFRRAGQPLDARRCGRWATHLS